MDWELKHNMIEKAGWIKARLNDLNILNDLMYGIETNKCKINDPISHTGLRMRTD